MTQKEQIQKNEDWLNNFVFDTNLNAFAVEVGGNSKCDYEVMLTKFSNIIIYAGDTKDIPNSLEKVMYMLTTCCQGYTATGGPEIEIKGSLTRRVKTKEVERGKDGAKLSPEDFTMKRGVEAACGLLFKASKELRNKLPVPYYTRVGNVKSYLPLGSEYHITTEVEAADLMLALTRTLKLSKNATLTNAIRKSIYKGMLRVLIARLGEKINQDCLMAQCDEVFDNNKPFKYDYVLSNKFINHKKM